MSKKRLYRYPLYLLLRALEWLSVHLPRPVVLAFMGGLAKFVWRVLPKERKKVLAHLRLAFEGAKTEEEIQDLGEKVFQNLAWTAVDALRAPLYKQKHLTEQLIRIEPDVFKKIDEALSKGKGLICLTGHIGNWELITLSVLGFGDYRGGVIGRKIYYEPFNQVLEKIRIACNAKIFYREDPVKDVLKSLRKNEVIGILPDQDVDSIEGEFINFFGTPAYTPTGPAKLSIASGAPILPVFMLREKNKYRFVARDLIWPEIKTTKEEASAQMTKEWSLVVEDVIRQYPEQWVWMHRRWKTQPNIEKVSSA